MRVNWAAQAVFSLAFTVPCFSSISPTRTTALFQPGRNAHAATCNVVSNYSRGFGR